MLSIVVEHKYMNALEQLCNHYPNDVYIEVNDNQLIGGSNDLVEAIILLAPTIALLVPLLHEFFEYIRKTKDIAVEKEKLSIERSKPNPLKVKITDGNISVEIETVGETIQDTMALAVATAEKLQAK